MSLRSNGDHGKEQQSYAGIYTSNVLTFVEHYLLEMNKFKKERFHTIFQFPVSQIQNVYF